MSGKLRVGIGFDIHALVTGRRLVLGGTEIPFAKGLSGWSDADVLIHAIIDALLGAAARGDIGSHFPPGKPEYKDISSLILLARIKDELTENGWQVNNIDTTIVAEKPKLSDYIGPMRRQLSQALDVAIDRISVKASTSDKLGSIGRGEGIAAYAIVTLEEK